MCLCVWPMPRWRPYVNPDATMADYVTVPIAGCWLPESTSDGYGA